MKITSYIHRGNSFPVILEKEGRLLFVKLRAGMSGQYALVNEWIGNKIGQQLNINTQNPFWIALDSALKYDHIYIEVRELISKSMGINIGFNYQESVEEVPADEIHNIDSQVANQIFLLDLILLNIDRTSTNNNLIQTAEGIFSIDYESSLLIQDLKTHNRLFENREILKCLKKNPLYSEVNTLTIHNFLKKLYEVNFEQLFTEIPNDVLAEEDKTLILKGIENRQNNKWFIEETLDQLKQISLDTPEEEKQRMNKNQAKFIRNLKKNIHF